jgi:hypothetical protein
MILLGSTWDQVEINFPVGISGLSACKIQLEQTLQDATRRYETLRDATRRRATGRYEMLRDATRRYETLRDTTRRYKTL